ncbi:MAG: Hpt domain-containing protein, partial [Casimicrobiaceae bacterium]
TGAQPMSQSVIDPHVFDELQANAGADFVIELVDTFAEEAPALLTEMRSAVLANGAAGAAERFRRAAHSLKSNSHTFGATRMAEMARTLELGGMPHDASGVDALAHEFATTLAALHALARA